MIAKIKTAKNLKQARTDGSQFGPGNQDLWLKRNFPKIEKTMISGPKRHNSATKKGYATTTKLFTINSHTKTP